jgi:NADP-dependent 3-hydroxy acid dehydrogenase YdfG
MQGRVMQSGGAIIPIVGDTTDKESIKAVVKELESKEQYLDILVNNS